MVRHFYFNICDMIKRNVGVGCRKYCFFEILANKEVKLFCFIVFSDLINSVSRCLILMGFVSKCSIFKLPESGIKNSKLKTFDKWSFLLIVSHNMTMLYGTLILSVSSFKYITYFDLRHDNKATTSVAPIHFLVFLTVPPSCSLPCGSQPCSHAVSMSCCSLPIDGMESRPVKRQNGKWTSKTKCLIENSVCNSYWS